MHRAAVKPQAARARRSKFVIVVPMRSTNLTGKVAPRSLQRGKRFLMVFPDDAFAGPDSFCLKP